MLEFGKGLRRALQVLGKTALGLHGDCFEKLLAGSRTTEHGHRGFLTRPLKLEVLDPKH